MLRGYPCIFPFTTLSIKQKETPFYVFKTVLGIGVEVSWKNHKDAAWPHSTQMVSAANLQKHGSDLNPRKGTLRFEHFELWAARGFPVNLLYICYDSQGTVKLPFLLLCGIQTEIIHLECLKQMLKTLGIQIGDIQEEWLNILQSAYK